MTHVFSTPALACYLTCLPAQGRRHPAETPIVRGSFLLPGASERSLMNQETTQPTLPAAAAATCQLEPPRLGRIARALRRVGDFGEVHLIVERGQVRFIKIVLSESVNAVKR